MSILRAQRVDFQIAPGYFLEFYRLPNGEKRIGLTGLAISCGLRKEFFSKMEVLGEKQLQALWGTGFTGCAVDVSVTRNEGRGASKAKTLSIEDARRFIEFAAFDLGKKPALAIARAMMGIAIDSIARQAFGEEALTLDEIRAYICSEFAKTLDWLEEDRDDSRMIDQHLIFLGVG